VLGTGLSLALAAALLPGAVAPQATPPTSAGVRPVAATTSAVDPARWGNRRLAAQLTFSCVDLGDLATARRHARAGIGGITLLGSDAPSRLRARLTAVRRASPTRVAPFVASDEEGGTVQRLRRVIYRLPPARTMGRWPAARVRRTAEDYATRMRRLGVRMDLAPVADLAVPGYYIDSLDRAFSPDPDRVTRQVRAWRRGMADAGVVTVLKHWPGHGRTRNSHTGPARVPPLATLERRDLLPFQRELDGGAEVVMVGHLLSRGLTRGGVPASLSPRALRYLRRSAGPDTVLVTDSLAMAAASSSLGITPARAAVRALRAGADWAMPCDAAPLRAVAAIRRALDAGTIPREQAIASARRILDLKARWGLAPPQPSG
jgi:beta-N-acetylhexosaminidase